MRTSARGSWGVCWGIVVGLVGVEVSMFVVVIAVWVLWIWLVSFLDWDFGLSVNILCSDGVLEMMFLIGLMSSQYLVTNVTNFLLNLAFLFNSAFLVLNLTSVIFWVIVCLL